MWLQFFSQNFHFAVNLFASLVLFAIAWLYLDAWLGGRAKKELCKWVGFTLAALSFLVHATIVEQSVLGSSPLGSFSNTLYVVLQIVGLGLIILGSIIDPLQIIPSNKGLVLDDDNLKPEPKPKPEPAKPGPKPEPNPEPTVVRPASSSASTITELAAAGSLAAQPAQPATQEQKQAKAILGLSIPGVTAVYVLALGALTVAGLYWRRATTGLERHLKRVAVGFLLIAVSNLVSAASSLRDTSHPLIYGWVQSFGWVWWVEQAFLLAGALVLGIWVWSYLTKRFVTQLFMVLMNTTVIIFFVVTVSFTALLLRSVRSAALTNLHTAANVLGYAIEAKQAETRASAEQLAANADVVRAIQAKDHAALANLTNQFLADKKLTSLLITADSGQVLLRGEDTEKWGDAISSDTLIRRALLGEGASTVSAYEGAVAPSVRVRSAVPVKDAQGVIVGSVSTGLALDSAFVDGIQSSAGLQSSIYAGNTLAATTVVWADGKTRSTGVKLKDTALTDKVLKRGETYEGNVSLQNRSLLTVFVPLKDVDGAVQGMLMASQPETAILRTAGRSIELTFLMTSLLLVVSILPIYLVAKAIVRQLD